MAEDEATSESFADKDHQSAYIFDPSEGAEIVRPAKRRKVSKKHAIGTAQTAGILSARWFQPLFEAAEDDKSVSLRQELFEASWSQIQQRIQDVLKEANQSTLNNVADFVREAPALTGGGQIPSAFIITGANIASQNLLFEQLSDRLEEKVEAEVVRLRSGDASNLKAALKKIIRDVTAESTDADDELEAVVSADGRRYLDYDLEALHTHLRSSPRHIVVAIQDSEAFDSGLLSDLILLFSSWRDRIPFALLFGVATSVELFQARLLSSTCRHLYGDQFDVEQWASIIEKIFKAAILHVDAPLRIGPSLLRSLLDRQREQVAGLPFFVSSLKYAYMCHFYANPLSVLLSTVADLPLQKHHFEAVRLLPSFRRTIETMVENGETRETRSLLNNDDYLASNCRDFIDRSRQWSTDALRCVKLLTALKVSDNDLVKLYLDALSNGVHVTEESSEFLSSVQRLQPLDAMDLLNKLISTIEHGDKTLGLPGWASEVVEAVAELSSILTRITELHGEAEENGHALRSRYSGQNKVLRTTVVAQKVQLSREVAALTDEDKAYTACIDRIIKQLEELLSCSKLADICLHEAWLYDSGTPYRDGFIPRPRAVVERALSRPHDYLGCSCCRTKEDQILPTLPSTSILYQLYLETGSLINVADLWAAYYAIVGEENKDGLDERTALVFFYRGLSELRTLGFVKMSRKKVDHIAKLAWRGL